MGTASPTWWQNLIGVASLLVALGIIGWAWSQEPPSPPERAAPTPQVQYSTRSLGDITCVRIYQGGRTLHRECLR